jgi:hypothetical protein
MRRLHSQLERFVASSEDDRNPLIGISKLCAQKKDKGYNFAMFTDKMQFDDADVELRTHMKPGCWHFTELTNWMLMDEDLKYRTDDGDIVPNMFNWIMDEHFHVDEYADQHLVFLKYTEQDVKVLRQVGDRDKLMSYAESQIPFLHRVIMQASDIKFFEWHRMKADGYKGVLVGEHENDGQPFGGWNCYPTLAIWDQSLLTSDKTSFHRNAGSFQYTE